MHRFKQPAFARGQWTRPGKRLKMAVEASQDACIVYGIRRVTAQLDLADGMIRPATGGFPYFRGAREDL